MLTRKMLDSLCVHNGFTGYKNYLKSDLYKSVVKNACAARPACHYCNGIARDIQFINPDAGNLFGTSLDGIVTTCLACSHSIKHGAKGKKRTVNQQAKHAEAKTPANRSQCSHRNISAERRDHLLRANGFANFAAYSASRLFSFKTASVLEAARGKCSCCRRKAAGVHFRWYSESNLLTEDNSGLIAICNDCRKCLGHGKQSVNGLKKLDKRLHALQTKKAEQRTDIKTADQEKRAAAMESTSGNCCSCTEKAAGVQKFGQNYAPLCFTCNGKTGFDKDFYDHVQWLADSLAKGKLSMQTKEPPRRRFPDAGPLTKSTDIKTPGLHGYVKIVRQPNGDSTDCPF